jgi:hypothetical protein
MSTIDPNLESQMAEGEGMTKWADKALTRRTGVILVLVNLVGAVVCRSLTTMTWVINQERKGGLHPVTAENAMIWTLISLPIVACFFALNVGWGTVILCYRKWKAGRLWLVAFLIWLIAFGAGFVHR